MLCMSRSRRRKKLQGLIATKNQPTQDLDELSPGTARVKKWIDAADHQACADYLSYEDRMKRQGSNPKTEGAKHSNNVSDRDCSTSNCVGPPCAPKRVYIYRVITWPHRFLRYVLLGLSSYYFDLFFQTIIFTMCIYYLDYEENTLKIPRCSIQTSNRITRHVYMRASPKSHTTHRALAQPLCNYTCGCE